LPTTSGTSRSPRRGRGPSAPSPRPLHALTALDSTLSAPSGTLIIRATIPARRRVRSAGAGRLGLGLRDAIITIVRSPRSASLMSSMLRSWPTLTASPCPGTGPCRAAAIRRRARAAQPGPQSSLARTPSGAPTPITGSRPCVCLPVAVRARRSGREPRHQARSALPCARLGGRQRQLDAQHSVRVLRAGPSAGRRSRGRSHGGTRHARSRPVDRPRPARRPPSAGRRGSACDPEISESSSASSTPASSAVTITRGGWDV